MLTIRKHNECTLHAMHQPDPFSTILAIHSSVGVSSLRSDAERACTIYDHVTKGKSLAAHTARRTDYTENRGGWLTISVDIATQVIIAHGVH